MDGPASLDVVFSDGTLAQASAAIFKDARDPGRLYWRSESDSGPVRLAEKVAEILGPDFETHWRERLTVERDAHWKWRIESIASGLHFAGDLAAERAIRRLLADEEKTT